MDLLVRALEVCFDVAEIDAAAHHPQGTGVPPLRLPTPQLQSLTTREMTVSGDERFKTLQILRFSSFFKFRISCFSVFFSFN